MPHYIFTLQIFGSRVLFLRRQLTTASDVYGYGVVLLELLTGQVAIDHRRTEDYNLVGWVISFSFKLSFDFEVI